VSRALAISILGLAVLATACGRYGPPVRRPRPAPPPVAEVPSPQAEADERETEPPAAPAK